MYITAIIGMGDAAVMYRNDSTTRNGVLVGRTVLVMYGTIKDYYYSVLKHIEEDNAAFSHENLVNVDRSKWPWDNGCSIIMPPQPGKSIRCAIRSCFRHGLPENSVPFILHETLKALDYIHRIKNSVHLNVGADCVFVDGGGNVKLALRPLPYCPCDFVRRVHLRCRCRRRHHEFGPRCPSTEPSKCGGSGYPGWAIAPELTVDCGRDTDVWMFGLLAVELFYGRIPCPDDLQMLCGLSDDDDEKEKNNSSFGRHVLVSCIKRKKKKKEMPEQLAEVVAACLSGDRRKMPTTNQLMEYKLFQNLPENHTILGEACKIDIPICWVIED